MLPFYGKTGAKQHLFSYDTTVKSLVWNVAIYGSEARTLSKADNRKLEAFEIWLFEKNGKDKLD
jgi:hypothetical protein